MDMWTSISALGILAVTIHFINNNWQLEHFVLDVLYIPSPHNALAIKDSVLQITGEFEISNRLIGITADNEAKILQQHVKLEKILSYQIFGIIVVQLIY